MSTLERRLKRVAEAINDRNSGCTCNGQGSVFVVRYVAQGDPAQKPSGPDDRRPLCRQHPPRIRFEEFDRASGAYVEVDPKRPATDAK